MAEVNSMEITQQYVRDVLSACVFSSTAKDRVQCPLLVARRIASCQCEAPHFDTKPCKRREPEITVKDFTEHSWQWSAFQNKYK